MNCAAAFQAHLRRKVWCQTFDLKGLISHLYWSWSDVFRLKEGEEEKRLLGGVVVHQKGSRSESEEPPHCPPSPSSSNGLLPGCAVELGLAVTLG